MYQPQGGLSSLIRTSPRSLSRSRRRTHRTRNYRRMRRQKKGKSPLEATLVRELQLKRRLHKRQPTTRFSIRNPQTHNTISDRTTRFHHRCLNTCTYNANRRQVNKNQELATPSKRRSAHLQHHKRITNTKIHTRRTSMNQTIITIVPNPMTESNYKQLVLCSANYTCELV